MLSFLDATIIVLGASAVDPFWGLQRNVDSGLHHITINCNH